MTSTPTRLAYRGQLHCTVGMVRMMRSQFCVILPSSFLDVSASGSAEDTFMCLTRRQPRDVHAGPACALTFDTIWTCMYCAFVVALYCAPLRVMLTSTNLRYLSDAPGRSVPPGCRGQSPSA